MIPFKARYDTATTDTLRHRHKISPFSTVLDGTCSNQFSDADLLRPLPFIGGALPLAMAAGGVAVVFAMVIV